MDPGRLDDAGVFRGQAPGANAPAGTVGPIVLSKIPVAGVTDVGR